MPFPSRLRTRVVLACIVSLVLLSLLTGNLQELWLLITGNEEEFVIGIPSWPWRLPSSLAPQHTYRENGLLEVNPKAPHPIFELMSRGETLWEAKLAKQSTTLERAVKEYRKRYKRYPPPGFDEWWSYAEAHNVQLKDEYDQIHKDLEPFWAFSPQKIDQLREQYHGRGIPYYVIGKVLPQDNITVFSATEDSEYFDFHRKMILGVLASVQQWIPPFKAVINPEDAPRQLADREWRKATARASSFRKPLEDEEKIPPSTIKGFGSMCAQDTAFINTETDPSIPTSKTFIYDHSLARDPCNFAPPSQFEMHGVYLERVPPEPRTVINPIFSSCATPLHADIMFPSPYLWQTDTTDWNLPFSQKNNTRLQWRGANTGSHFTDDRPDLIENGHRLRFVSITNRKDGAIGILEHPTSPKAATEKVTAFNYQDVNPSFMNVSFAREPVQCQPESCKKLKESYRWTPVMYDDEAMHYKFIMDVDGNGWSGRFKRLITNRSLIFKTTAFLEWNSDRIMPWVHYVPINIDYSDLHDTLAFFRGDVDGKNAHLDLAEKIAEEGRIWSQTVWRWEDMVAYWSRLLLEYARVTSEDRLEQEFRPGKSDSS